MQTHSNQEKKEKRKQSNNCHHEQANHALIWG
jgi:hypothetical protein